MVIKLGPAQYLRFFARLSGKAISVSVGTAAVEPMSVFQSLERHRSLKNLTHGAFCFRTGFASMPDRLHTFAVSLRAQYASVFSRPWPVIPSALVIAALNVFLFAFDRPWTASDGIRNWGEWLFRLA